MIKRRTPELPWQRLWILLTVIVKVFCLWKKKKVENYFLHFPFLGCESRCWLLTEGKEHKQTNNCQQNSQKPPQWWNQSAQSGCWAVGGLGCGLTGNPEQFVLWKFWRLWNWHTGDSADLCWGLLISGEGVRHSYREVCKVWDGWKLPRSSRVAPARLSVSIPNRGC